VIDIHTHPVGIAELHEGSPDLTRAVREVYGRHMPLQPLTTYLAQLDEAGIDEAVALPIDCTTAHGCKIVTNEQVAQLMELSARIIGFASVDPGEPDAPETLRRAVREYGLRGLKLDPSLQQFAVGDRERAFPVYEACTDLDIPVMIHCGLNWAPRGMAALARPILLEEVLQAFPDLKIIIPHFGWPWVDETVMLALKHPNVHVDTSILYSGTPAESMMRVLVDLVGIDLIDRSLGSQVLFGSDYPRVEPKRFVWGFDELGLRPQLEEKIRRTNAMNVLGLGGGER
jgi:predicted TIM-barrel fold metal-dependent hydrolase